MSKRLLYASLAIVIIFECLASTSMATKPTVIAHRGASGYLPEHTLPAVALAYGMGADYMEPDVVLTKDGVPIIMHDVHLDATTDVAQKFPSRNREDGRYYAIDFTLEEIKQLSARERIRVKTGERVYGTRFPDSSITFQVPTLEEYIQFLQGLNHSTGREVGIYPEIKKPSFHAREGQDMASQIMPILEKYGFDTAESPIYLQSFDPHFLKDLRFNRGAKFRMVQLIGPNAWEEADCDYAKMITKEGLKEVASYASGIGIYLLQLKDDENKPKHAVTNPNVIADAKAAGLKVYVYTLRADDLPSYVNTLNDLHQLLFNEWQVDGVFTDFTDQTVQFVSEL